VSGDGVDIDEGVLAVGVTGVTTPGVAGILVGVAEVPAVVNAFDPQPASPRLKQSSRKRAIFVRIVESVPFYHLKRF
jgi:hypothetical protein